MGRPRVAPAHQRMTKRWLENATRPVARPTIRIPRAKVRSLRAAQPEPVQVPRGASADQYAWAKYASAGEGRPHLTQEPATGSPSIGRTRIVAFVSSLMAASQAAS